MPQMKPMNWLVLFILMNLILIFINIINFFIIIKKINNKNLNLNNKINNWKW